MMIFLSSTASLGCVLFPGEWHSHGLCRHWLEMRF